MKRLKLFQTVLFAGLITLATGCLKSNDQPAPAVSALSFIHASPDGPSVAFFADENKVSNDSLAYTKHTAYLNAYSGNRNVYAYVGSNQKVTGKIMLEQGKFYSLFLAGKWNSAEFVLLEDSLTKPDLGKVNIRFLNMSPDAPSLDLGLDDGTTLISGKEYKKNSGFIAIDAAKQYNFVIREHGSTQTKVSLPAITLNAGRVYTIWAKGIYEATGTTGPGAEIIENY